MIRFPHIDTFSFYDLQKDPEEMNDVSANPEYSGTINLTEKQLAKLMEEVGITKEFLLANMKNNRRARPGSHGGGRKKK